MLGVIAETREEVAEKILQLKKNLQSIFKNETLYFTELPVFSFRVGRFGVIDALYEKKIAEEKVYDFFEWKYSQKSSVEETMRRGFFQLFLLANIFKCKVNNFYVGIFDHNLNFILLRFVGTDNKENFYG